MHPSQCPGIRSFRRGTIRAVFKNRGERRSFQTLLLAGAPSGPVKRENHSTPRESKKQPYEKVCANAQDCFHPAVASGN